MKRKRHGPEQIIKKLREADAMMAADKTIGQVGSVVLSSSRRTIVGVPSMAG
jgi:hypothetical protein